MPLHKAVRKTVHEYKRPNRRTKSRTDVQKSGQELPLIPITDPCPYNPWPGPIIWVVFSVQ